MKKLILAATSALVLSQTAAFAQAPAAGTNTNEQQQSADQGQMAKKAPAKKVHKKHAK